MSGFAVDDFASAGSGSAAVAVSVVSGLEVSAGDSEAASAVVSCDD
jgi:hypothetical protein